MKTLNVTSRDGSISVIKAGADLTVMEALRDNGVDELLALCGGCCSCATCHIYLPSETISELNARSEDEDDLLDSSDHKSDNSRLSCQLKVSDLPDGCHITIAPED